MTDFCNTAAAFVFGEPLRTAPPLALFVESAAFAFGASFMGLFIVYKAMDTVACKKLHRI